MALEKRKILIIENEEKFFKEISSAIQEKLGDWFDIYPKLKEEQGTLNNFQHLLEDYIEFRKYEPIVEHYKETDFYVIDISLVKGRADVDGYHFVDELKSKQPEQEVKYMMISSLKNQTKCIWKGQPDWTGLVIKEILSAFPDIAKEREKSIPKDKSNSIFARIKADYKENGFWSVIDLMVTPANKLTRGLINLGITLVFYFLLTLTAIYATVNMYHEFWPVTTEHGPAVPLQTTSVPAESQTQIRVAVTQPPTPPSKNKSLSAGKPDQSHTDTSINQNHASGQNQTNAVEKNILEHAEKIFLYLLPLFIVFGFYIYYFTNTRIYFNDGRLSETDRETSMHAMNFTKTIFVSSLISYTLIETVDEIFTVRVMDIKSLVAAGVLLIILIGYFILLGHHNGTGHKSSKE